MSIDIAIAVLGIGCALASIFCSLVAIRHAREIRRRTP